MINNIILGDCLEKLKDVESNTIQMTLTDLPYAITNNNWDYEIPLDDLWSELLRVGKENCSFVFTSSQPFTSKLICSKMELWKHEWIWIKNRGSNFANTIREPFKEHETVQVFSKGKWKYNKQMQERTGNGENRVKYVINQRGKSENYRNFEGREGTIQGKLRVPSSWQKFNTEVGLHPTQKPVKLFEYLIKTYSDENDIVLDCCAGSGTTGVAAYNLNRKFILIEKEQKYYDIIIKRINKLNNEFFQ